VRDILDPRHARAPDLLQSSGFLHGLRALAARDLVFDMMLTPGQMRPAAALLAQAPGLRVAVEHAGSPHDRSAAGLALWRDGLAALAALPGCIVKLSALQCLEPCWTDHTLLAIIAPIRDLFTSGRMCIGTDWPVHDRTCPGPEALAALRRVTLDWPISDRKSLFTDTARQFYSISAGA
jgi:predicted TIM-barrel fold metal-dependent hydrolase